jgi:drug/metabolite transporter (DMT)-like permease
VIFGLAAALGWGCSDLLAAITARRIGSRETAAVAQSVGLLGLGALWPLTSQGWGLPAGGFVVLFATGCFAGIAYFALYRGLEIGPVALVSPIASAFASVTVVLAVVVLGESLRGARLAGVVLTLAGVLLASTDLRRFEVEARRHARGLPYALAAMAGFGVAAFVTGAMAKDYGWLPPITISRAGSLAFIAVALLLAGRRGRAPRMRQLGPAGAALAAAVGLTDILGIAAFARGSELGFVSIVVAASATFTLIPVAGGVVLFGERPAPNQIVGVVVVIAGLAMLGVG